MEKYTIEVSFSPALFPYRLTKDNYITVIVDILRATTSICAAFSNGVKEIVPVPSTEIAREYKQKGYLVASERDGHVLDFADFGNSAFNFMTEEVRGQSIVYSTTNGTKAIEMAKDSEQIVIGSFLNLNALAKWLSEQNRNVLILCAGWKNKFNIEDSLFGGSLTEALLMYEKFEVKCDSAIAAHDLWELAKVDVLGYIEKAAHRHRLKRLGLDDVLEYSFSADSSKVIPVFDGFSIVDKA
ncbi:MAG: 2-phosphosulfolactate phosphatase [Bacteroidales bacterium]|nr:2-phosphosulfolactate phosphatase [Bacteroidales bacterium]